jgi:hypothetical protein
MLLYPKNFVWREEDKLKFFLSYNRERTVPWGGGGGWLEARETIIEKYR